MTDETKMILDAIKSLKNDVNLMGEKMSSMDAKITDIQLTLENETNPNITAVAEGHLDLSRKLDDALKVENEKEMLIIRVNSLENEVRKLKDRIDRIA